MAIPPGFTCPRCDGHRFWHVRAPTGVFSCIDCIPPPKGEDVVRVNTATLRDWHDPYNLPPEASAPRRSS